MGDGLILMSEHSNQTSFMVRMYYLVYNARPCAWLKMVCDPYVGSTQHVMKEKNRVGFDPHGPCKLDSILSI
jgi:hypothetical protein